MQVRKFYADSMLGKTARWLRLMGFSVEYAPSDITDDEILDHCRTEDAFLLTRDKDLSRRYEKSLYFDSDNYVDHLKLFLGKFKSDENLYFTRCPLCNGEIKMTPIDEYRGKVPEGVRERFQVLHICTKCGKVYWEGSHFDSILAALTELNSGEEQ